RLWDRSARSLAVEIQHTQVVCWTGFTADSAYLATLGPELVVTDVVTGARVGEASAGSGGLTAAIDDSRGLVAVACLNEQGLAVFRLPQATPLEGLQAAQRRKQGENAFAMCLDLAGDHLVIATNRGVRVYSWTSTIAGGPSALKVVHAVSMPFVYAAALDTARGRVLYGGIDGALAALDLTTGAA